jgi:hypothetical protein
MNVSIEKSKIITIEEREPIANENADSVEYKIISARKFRISKYPAKDGLKTARLIIAKLLPVFESFISPDKVAQIRNGKTAETENEIWELLSVDNVIKALELISDDDLDVIYDRALKNCYEILPAGDAQILNSNGTYGVEGIEYDYILSLRLVAESLIWSIGSFFAVTRLTSIMEGLKVSFSQNAGI